MAEGEKILFVGHKHWIEIFKMSTKIFFLGWAMPWVLWMLFPPMFWLSVLWTIFASLIYLSALMDWYFDAWLVTNMSMLDVEWKSLFHRLSSRVDFNDIKEIAYEKKGFLGTVLNYGDIYAGLTSGDHVVLKNANNPKNIELYVLKIREEYINGQKMQNADALQELLVDIVHKHIAEKGVPPKK